MDFGTVQQNLNDLPGTFKREGAPYTQWVDALTTLLFFFTNAADSMIAEATDFAAAQFGWADVWGEVFQIQRLPNEGTPTYKQRIKNILTANHVTPLAMTSWLNVINQVNGLIIENLPNVGYNITLPAGLTSTRVQQIIAGLGMVRPAGVPFTVNTLGIGTYLDSINFLNTERVTGSYLSGGTSNIGLTISAGTNNSVPLIPDLLFVDPTINNPAITAPL